MSRGIDFARWWLRSAWRSSTPAALHIGRLPPVCPYYSDSFPGPSTSVSCCWVMLPSLGSSAAKVPGEPGTARRTGRSRRATPSEAVQAHLAGYNIDVLKVVKLYPAMASYDVQRVQKVTAFLHGLGVDVRRVVQVHPVLLAGKLEKYEAVMRLLQSNGVDVARVINFYPNVLKVRPTTLQRTMDVISSCNCCARQTINSFPAILRLSVSDVSAILDMHKQSNSTKGSDTNRPMEMHPKAKLLSSLGLEVNWLMKRMPRLLMLNANKLQTTVDYLKSVGVDVSHRYLRLPVFFESLLFEHFSTHAVFGQLALIHSLRCRGKERSVPF
eukprot:EG_transcript_18745